MVHNMAPEVPLALAIRDQLYETLAVVSLFSRERFEESGLGLHDAYWDIATKVYA